VKFQTKAPLSVGYKAVLVHEFARPPKFALRSKIRNEFSATLLFSGKTFKYPYSVPGRNVISWFILLYHPTGMVLWPYFPS